VHILIIPFGHFATQRYPLGSIFQYQQANTLHDAGHRVGVISPGIISSRFLFRRYPYPNYETVNGYPVLRHYVRKLAPQRWVCPKKSIPFYQKLGLGLFELYISRFGKPDVIHAHDIKFAGFIAQYIRDLYNVPYIITEHSNTLMFKEMSPEWRSKMKKVVQGASAMTAVSSALERAIEKQIGVHAIDVLPNIVDSFFLENSLPKPGAESSFFRFLNIAALDENKDQASLINAFFLQFKNKKVQLRIGGVGPKERQLKKLVHKLGLETQVVFLGYLDRGTVLREMQGADCFVLSSRQETFGVVLIEALASGTPVIATRCGGPDEIVNEKNGLLVPPRDNVALSKAMVWMVQEKGRFRAEALREECNARFGKEVFVTTVKRFYKTAMGSL
jgi:glycosyltransferase involved in cell wall biosynthesis